MPLGVHIMQFGDHMKLKLIKSQKFNIVLQTKNRKVNTIGEVIFTNELCVIG